MSLVKRKRINERHFHSSNRIGEGIALSYISSQWMADKWIVEPREMKFLDYQEQATLQFQELQDSLSNENITSIDTARSVGVSREWEVYNFFAQDHINAPEDVFSYVDDKGQVTPFTESEIELISQMAKGDSRPIDGIEGHHMELVSHNPDNMDLAADPDNILFATEQGHREFLHGGNPSNATDPAYFAHSKTMDEKFDLTIQHNQDVMTLNGWEAGALTVGSSMLFYVSVSTLIEWYKLKNDPCPWSEKREHLLKSGVAASVFGAGLGSVGYMTHLSVGTLFSDVSPSMMEHFFTDMLAINSSIFAIAATGALLRYYWSIRKGQSTEQAKKDFQQVMMVVTAEFLAFSALGLGLDVLGSVAMDTVTDALIPDPTGILIAARVTYGIFKMGKKMWDSNQNKAAVQECIESRLRYLGEKAEKEQSGGLTPGAVLR